MTTQTREYLAIERENENENESGDNGEMTQAERDAIAAELWAERDAMNQMDADRAADSWFDMTHGAFN